MIAFGQMRSALKMAIKALWANKLRSLLTLIGVVLGVASIIVVQATSEGLQNDFQRRFEEMGSNLVMVYPNWKAKTPVMLEMGDVEAIRRQCRKAKMISAQTSDYAKIAYKNKSMQTSLVGADMEYPVVRNLQIDQGRYFSQSEYDAKRKLAVIGGKTLEALFPNGDALGAEVKINNMQFRIIGTLEARGEYEFDMTIIPLTTAQQRVFGDNKLRQINVQAESMEATAELKKEIANAIAPRRGEKPDEFKTFMIYDSGDTLKQGNEQQKTIAIFLAIIGGISLTIGGVGIMNIMLISVTERTREIGIRKAIGARRSDIMMQFLIESTALCLFGGGLGVALADYINGYVSTLEFFPELEMNMRSILLALAVSVGIGVVFGLWPAWLASKKAPIEALRYD